MSILKIRNEDGSIQSIAIMRGVGVPDGGEAGQVVKKTEGGTEWGAPFAFPAVVLSNTDTEVTSASITQRGLYEVDIAYTYYSGADYTHHKHLVSIDDLGKTQEWELTVGVLHRANTAAQEYNAIQYLSTLAYDNGELSSKIRARTTIAGTRVSSSVEDTSFLSYIAEVKLLIPYA